MLPIAPINGTCGSCRVKSQVIIKCWIGSKLDKPVREWIAELDDQSFKQIDKLLSMLRQEGKNLAMPYTRERMNNKE